MAAPAYAGSVSQPNYRQAPARSPGRQPAPSGPRTSPRRPPGTRPRDPRVIPSRPVTRPPAEPRPSVPVRRPPPDYNPRPIVPEKPARIPQADPFRPPSGLPAGVALDLAGKALSAYAAIGILVDPEQIFMKPGAFNGYDIFWDGNHYDVGLSCGSGPIGTGWGFGGAGGLCGTPLQVPGSSQDYDGAANGGNGYFRFENFQGYTIFDPLATYVYRGPFNLDRTRYNINWEWGPFPRFVDRNGWPSPIADPVVTPKFSAGVAFGAAVKPPLAILEKPGEFYSLPSQWPEHSLDPRPRYAFDRIFDPVESDKDDYGPKRRRRNRLRPRPRLKPYEVSDMGAVVLTPNGVEHLAPGGHAKLPPNKGDRERKARIGSPTLRVVMGILGALTEAGDLIDAIYKAIPAKGTHRRWKGRDGKWREAAITPQGKLAFIYANWQKVDISDALWNIVENEAEDRAFGYLGNRLKKTYASNHAAGYKPNNMRGFQSGPAL